MCHNNNDIRNNPYHRNAGGPASSTMQMLSGLFLTLLVVTALSAKTPLPTQQGQQALVDYIVQLEQPGAAQATRFSSLYGSQSGSRQVDAAAELERKLYLQQLRSQRALLLQASAAELGHGLQVKHEYEHLLNGFAVTLSAEEARRMAAMPGVLSVFASRSYALHLDAGPALIGAPDIWNGVNGLPTRAEGIVIGIIDSGINWEHPFFAGTTEDGFVFTNPRGSQLGLCSNPQVQCNNKLIGVYDFTTEGEQIGRDLNGHGSHVASIAAGNLLTRTLTINGLAPITLEMAGVAQRANLISYKACQAPDDAPVGSPPSCEGQAMVDALDQALADGVDVFNFSIGGEVREDPWLYLRTPGIQDLTEIFLELREAGLIGVVSAGNSGPGPGTIATPANGPWSPAVGNISHGREQAKTLDNLTGGATTPPGNIIGVGATAASATLPIVHARDFGNAFCGTGPAELGPACGNNSGASNPFPPGTFNGQIVVCDRGVYGRVEKGRNVQLAGAAGMILANTDLEAEDIVADQHCLPAMHIGDTAGDALRNWLDAGSNHRGRIGATEIINDAFFAGVLRASSSIGPNAEIPGVLKPNLVAPGANILGASFEDDLFLFLTGTSMAAPHITGAYALLKAANPDWNSNQILSALETTSIWPLPGSSTPSGVSADQRGAGVPVLADAVRAGLYLDISGEDFRAADPTTGGNPQDLNLPGIQLLDCQDSCQTTRRVTDMQGGGQWTLSTDQSFLQVSPTSINLADGQSAVITVSATLNNPNLVGTPQSARVTMTSNSAQGGPLTQTLPVAVQFSGGELPDRLQVQTAAGRDKASFSLSGLVALPRASWQPSRLVLPTRLSANLGADPTSGDPYDDDAGARTQLITVGGNSLRLRAVTLASTAQDVDLFVGQDLNGNGQAEIEEERCRSITFTDIESCVIDNPQPGNWWIRVQVFTGSGAASDLVEADYAVLDAVANPSQQNLFVRAPGITQSGETFDFTLAWDVDNLRAAETAWGVIGVGSSPDNANNIGLIPVEITRTSLSQQQATPLFDGRERIITLPAGGQHERLFIDVPDNVVGLQISVDGSDAELDLVRQPFAQAFAQQPAVQAAPANAEFSLTADADGQIEFSVPAAAVQAGRWYLVVRNAGQQSRSYSVQAVLQHASGELLAARETAYTRDGSTRQGVDFGRVNASYGLLWYTFDEQQQPIFYNFAGPVPMGQGSGFQGRLVTPVSDGIVQQTQPVGWAAVTFLNADEFVMSYDLLGTSGSELMQANAGQLTCPQTPQGDFNVHGVWDIVPKGNGGISMLALAAAQGYIRYFFDDSGVSRWLFGTASGNVVSNPAGNLVQIRGACPDCPPITPSLTTVGSFAHSFSSDQQTGEQLIEFDLLSPLSASRNGIDPIFRLSDAVVCEN
ncbi:MAG: S8 family serine peptidase [Gammaproteobacteria bacterium]|nr:S8 family serine peptidase [Gammaproteobacteria bacterium]